MKLKCFLRYAFKSLAAALSGEIRGVNAEPSRADRASETLTFQIPVARCNTTIKFAREKKTSNTPSHHLTCFLPPPPTPTRPPAPRARPTNCSRAFSLSLSLSLALAPLSPASFKSDLPPTTAAGVDACRPSRRLSDSGGPCDEERLMPAAAGGGTREHAGGIGIGGEGEGEEA